MIEIKSSLEADARLGKWCIFHMYATMCDNWCSLAGSHWTFTHSSWTRSCTPQAARCLRHAESPRHHRPGV
jgi:hypothetical protein